MKRGLAILPLIAVASCSGSADGFDAEDRVALDWAVLEAAPGSVPLYTEVGLTGCRMSGDTAVCGSCTTTVATADHDYTVDATLEEHVMGRTDSESRIRVSVTSELDYAEFPHSATRSGVDSAIAAAHAWCEAFHPERYEVINDRRDTNIATGDEE